VSNIYLLYPELLLLLVPLVFFYFWRARSRGVGGITRLVILATLALLAAIPLAPLGGKGVDVVVVADLSRSMPRTRAAGNSKSSISLRNDAPQAIASAL
jgi:hypothetical protein